MKKLNVLGKTLLRISAALLGFGLLARLVVQTGPAVVWRQLQSVGWGLALVMVLGGISQLVRACAWRQTFTCDVSRLSWRRSVGVQLVSDAAGQLGFAGKVVGEGLRVSLLGATVPLPSGIAASVIDGGLHSLSAVVVTVSGISVSLLVANLSDRWRADAVAVAIILVFIVILAGVAVARRIPLMGKTLRTIGRLPILRNFVSDKQPIIDSAEHNLLEFYRSAPKAFWRALGLNFLWHFLAVFEVFLILHFMGADIRVLSAFVTEGLTKVINLVGVLNPGNLGTYEGGNMLIAKFLGVPATAGLTLALCRRARIIFWAAVGAMCMFFLKQPAPLAETAASVGA